MMAAVDGRGDTEILNAARDPEVCDLGACLVAMGAQIEGAGTHRVTIRGVPRLHRARHEIIPDRIEAGDLRGGSRHYRRPLELTGARLEHLSAVGAALEGRGGPDLAHRPGPDGVAQRTAEGHRHHDRAVSGFPTDLQAQFMALMAIADGASMIRETVFENASCTCRSSPGWARNVTLAAGHSALVRGVGGLKAHP